MIQWLMQNIGPVMEIIGIAFSLLWAITKLTPTPDDEQLVEAAENWYEKILGVLAKLFSIDTTGGRSKSNQ